jgi:branched-chain amino acid transport system permease protein
MAHVSVRRWSRAAAAFLSAAGLGGLLLAALPYLVPTAVTQPLVTLFLFVAMAVTWNLLAGYAGMVSFGQQAYLGIGAYTVYVAGLAGVNPYLAIPIALLVAAVLSYPTSFALFRLTGGYFAVATWVVAEVLRLFVTTQSRLGGGAGVGLRQLNQLPLVFRLALTYWSALAVMAVCVAAVYLLVRSRAGLDSRALHDDPVAAATVGVDVQRSKRVAYVVAAAGAGAVGAVILINTLYLQPNSIFSVQYSAYMLFMVVIGGVGTMEGAILGAVLFFAIQQWFSQSGAWYLVGLGALAMLMTVALPPGLWGVAAVRGWSLMPIGYRVGSVR